MTTVVSSVERRFLTVEEVAQYAGISKHTLYTMVSQRRIPYTKVGRLTRFDRKTIDHWLDDHTMLPLAKKVKLAAAITNECA
jgi:excisionase family DNA binding protein